MGFFETARKKRELENQLNIAKMEREIARIETGTSSLRAQQNVMKQFTNSGYSKIGRAHV